MPPPAPTPRSLWISTIGLKVVMAGTGLLLVGFVVFHMLGNLQVFAGRVAFNDYAEFMQGLGGLLWAARLGLLGLLVAHVGSALMLVRRNMAARPRAYVRLRHKRSSMWGRTMTLTGIVVLAYIAYHLAHFTLGMAHPEHFGGLDEAGRPDVYTNFVLSFQNPVIVVTYVAANVAVAAHLSHATTSVFRTLGFSVGRIKDPLAKVGPALGAVVAVGNLSMPLACLFGAVTV